MKMFLRSFKYFASSFLVYLLFLAVLPCLDDCSVEFCQTEGVVHMENRHTDDHEDMCSPLCNCLCCNTLVSISAHQNLTLENRSVQIGLSGHANIISLSYKPTSPPPKA
ncbi:MAG: hypothetical protein JNK43_05495 [Ignavibacteria bacterium]|nr:hypothetical protein [Ignavibacteria bacterium]